MAILHPQECYLLETFSSLEHFAATRDAIIELIDAHEAAYAHYQQELPVRIRSEPSWKQVDSVWGGRILPNLRCIRDRYINAFILRTHNDPAAFNIGHAMSSYNRNIGEFWDGWMTQGEKECIRKAFSVAFILDKQLSGTISGSWNDSGLTYRGAGNIYDLTNMPRRIPRYVLDKDTRVEIGGFVVKAGIYLPDAELAPARFLYPGVDNGHPSPLAIQGVKRSEWVNESTGHRDYSWEKTRYAETGWTLIRRVDGEYIDVPSEGFFPNRTSDELYNWPERERDYITREREFISVWSGILCPHSGDWSVFTGAEIKNITLKQGQIMPYLSGVNDTKRQVCWTLISREDGGSVFKGMQNRTEAQ